MKSLLFTQICYDESQVKECYPFASIFASQNLTPFFENRIIADIVPLMVNSGADYISVCSWRLKEKRQSGPTFRVLNGDTSLSAEKILSQEFDIAVLTPRSASHQMLNMAEHWHGRPWREGFAELKLFLKNELDIKVPQEITHAIYENHFVAKASIYKAYVTECLVRVMEFMEGKEVFLQPSGYYKRKRASPEEIGRIKRMLGFEDWPIAPFLLERLFSIWVEGKGLNIINV